MVDLLVAFLAFFLAFQLTAVALGTITGRERLALAFGGGRGLALVLLPVFVGLGAAALSVFPHLLGALAGESHAPSDQDLLENGRLSPLLIGLLIFVGLRLLFRVVTEGRISLHLFRALQSPSEALLNKVLRASEPCADTRPVPRIRFHASPRFYEPFVRGLFQPAIYLHIALVEELNEEHLRAALLHEVGHHVHGDHLIKGLYSVFLIPIGLPRAVRLGYEEWVDSSERKCDDLASDLVGSRRAVAEALVAVFKLATDRHAPETAAGLCGHRSIKQRVARLISSDQCERDSSGARSLLATSGLAVLAMVLFVGFYVPSYGLELYCFLEHIVGTHCVG